MCSVDDRVIKGQLETNKNQGIPVFLAADDNYAPLVLTTILSIADHTQEVCDFYILDGGITEESKNIITEHLQDIKNVNFTFVSMREKVNLNNFMAVGHVTLPAYYRFFIADTFPELDKAIYLDVDVIFQGDIKELYAVEMGQYIMGAVVDQGPQKIIASLKKNLRLSMISVYLNSGVLLLNLSLWRQNRVIDKLFEIERKYHGRLYQNDQDILNVYFENNYLLMDVKFNAMDKYVFPYIIRHYAGLPKPWEIKPELCRGEFEDYQLFWDYLKQTRFYERNVKKCKFCNKLHAKARGLVKKFVKREGDV